MSVPPDPNSTLSRLCLSTATADQAGRSEHVWSLQRILKNQEHKRHPNELRAIALVIYQTYITLASDNEQSADVNSLLFKLSVSASSHVQVTSDALTDRPDPLSLCSGEVSLG